VNWLYIIIGLSWIGFWVYWIVSAVRTGLKRDATQPRRHRLLLPIVVIAFYLFVDPSTNINKPTFQHQSILLKTLGVVIFYGGIALAVWARRTMGNSWGIPMTVKSGSKLITSGPYKLIRHPIYAAINLMLLGSAILLIRVWLVFFVLGSIVAVYSSLEEEKSLAKQFPKEYPNYKKRTKMLVPYLI
jgi:protein-S-isoprenylcysteine O-methyltransferase Ste14